MRCHYLSDLHLEAQGFDRALPKGDILIIAGDLCHARCLDPSRTDKYSVDQRGRVHRFVDAAQTNFRHILLVAGNHDHYDGVFEETIGVFRRFLPGVTVLDNDHVDIGDVCFFGTTLWSDFGGRSPASMDAVRRRMGEYFFVRKRALGETKPVKLRPEDAADAFDTAVAALRQCAVTSVKPIVVISHHAPSLQGLNPAHKGNGLDPAYASDLDHAIAGIPNLKAWVHGHTHIRRRYRIDETVVYTNCRGFEGRDLSARSFAPAAYFDIDAA